MTQKQHEELNKAIYQLMENSQYSYKEARIICAYEMGLEV